MTVNFKTLVEYASKTTLAEDFTDILGKPVVSDLDDESAGKTIGRHVNTGDSLKIAEAASHPNAEKWHLDKALDHGKLDHIVAMHPKAPLAMLKRIINNSADDLARVTASHNHNMTPRTLELAYGNETNPAIKSEMLRSRHMPQEILETEAAKELMKTYPSQHKLESIISNVNTPGDVSDSAQARLTGKSVYVRKSKSSAIFKTAEKLTNDFRLNNGTSLNDINISHEVDPETHSLTISGRHDFDDTAPGVTSAGTFNSKAKDWARIGARMDDLTDDEHIKKYFDISKTSMSLGRANSAAKTRVEGEPLQHSATLKLTLKPEYQ